MNKQIFEEIVQKHDKTEAFISMFFAGVDFIIYFILLITFGCNFNKNFLYYRQVLSILIILDLIFRIINLYFNSFLYSLVNELLKTLFASIQFYLIIFLINQIFTVKNKESLFKNLKLPYPILSSALFFIFAMALNISKKVSLIQYVLVIIVVLVYGYYAGGKIELFLKIVEKKKPNFNCKNFIHNLTLFISLFFVTYYFLKIISLLIENELYISYMEMLCDIFKEVGRYFSFILVIILYYLFKKYIKEEDYESDSNSNQVVVNISRINSS